MDDDKAKTDQCKTDIGIAQKFRDAIPAIVEELTSSCTRHDCFDHVGPEPIPRGRPLSTPYTWRAGIPIRGILFAHVWMRSTWDTISARS